MKDLVRRFSEHWQKRGFDNVSGPALLALSGGVDSVVLANLLLAARIPFAAAHCNFSLRAADSAGDAAFVQDWCASRGITCHTETFKTAEIAAKGGKSIQVTARDLRYKWFEQLCGKYHYAAVLTAHHADDVAETMLINLCRGTGIAGLHGIPERRGKVIRPLLFATRDNIVAFALEQNIQWREDASNAKTDYLRNAIRHEVLSRLETLMPGASSRIAETATRIGEAEGFYRQSMEKRLAKLMQQRGRDWYIPVKLLKKSDGLNAIAYELFTPFGFSPEQIPHILRLLHSESGRSVDAPAHRVIRHRDFLVITSKEEQAADILFIEEVPKTVHTAEGEFIFSWTSASGQINSDADTALLHGDDIILPLILRTRREGDYFYPLGMGGKKKKLKRFLIDIKAPIHEKDRIRILEWDRKILWIAGKRIDERFIVRQDTKRILKVVFQPA